MLHHRLVYIWLLCLNLGFIPSLLIAAPHHLELKPFDAIFQIKRNGVTLGTLHLQLNITTSGNYDYRGYSKPGTVIDWFYSEETHEISDGYLQDNSQPVPIRYEYWQTDGEPKRHIELEFDWSAKKVWTTSEGQRWSQSITPGHHDRLSQQLALRIDLASGKKQTSYPVADGGRIKTYHYRVTGINHVNLPYGRLKCLQVRRHKEGKTADYTIWIAEEMDYLPVKIEQRRSSGHYTMELLQLKHLDRTSQEP